jgi:hypothetical protein
MSEKNNLQQTRQYLRDQKAHYLREYRRYKKKYGQGDYITGFMKGMAAGVTPAIIMIEGEIQNQEIRNAAGL